MTQMKPPPGNPGRFNEHDQTDHPSLDINALFLGLVRVALIL